MPLDSGTFQEQIGDLAVLKDKITDIVFAEVVDMLHTPAANARFSSNGAQPGMRKTDLSQAVISPILEEHSVAEVPAVPDHYYTADGARKLGSLWQPFGISLRQGALCDAMSRDFHFILQ